MIVRHQLVLERLLESHPNNTGLMRAYNNSLLLEERFSEKTAIRFNRTMEKNNKTILKAIRLEQKEQERHGKAADTIEPNETRTRPRVTETRDQQTEQEKNQNKVSGSDTTAPSVTGSQQQGSGNSNNAGDKGKGSSKNK
jgi:hypothetical protein